MWVDSHAHLDDRAFSGDLEAVLARARDGGVRQIVSIGTDLASSRRAREISERHEDVFFSPGIHPHEADHPGPADDLLELARHPRAVAVGETGLDYVKNYASIPNQKALFEKHLGVASAAGKPISIHCREAHADAIEILRKCQSLRGVIHCFSGTWEDAQAYLSLDFYLSIAGPVTYPNAQRLREVVRQIPLDRLLVETDCPLLAPQMHRGQRNEPAFVRFTGAEIAQVRGIPLEEVGERTSLNARNLFGF